MIQKRYIISWWFHRVSFQRHSTVESKKRRIKRENGIYTSRWWDPPPPPKSVWQIVRNVTRLSFQLDCHAAHFSWKMSYLIRAHVYLSDVPVTAAEASFHCFISRLGNRSEKIEKLIRKTSWSEKEFSIGFIYSKRIDGLWFTLLHNGLIPPLSNL